MSRARTLHAAAILALPALLPAPPAAAQTQTQICAQNTTPVTITRSRFHYNDWRGTRHTSQWQTLAVGQRNCVRLQDVTNVVVEFDRFGTDFRWADVCEQRVEANGRSVEVVAYAVMSGLTQSTLCAVR